MPGQAQVGGILVQYQPVRTPVTCRHLTHDFESLVLGTVIGQNNFQGRIRLSECTLDCLPDEMFLIVGTDYERHQRFGITGCHKCKSRVYERWLETAIHEDPMSKRLNTSGFPIPKEFQSRLAWK